MSTAERSRWLTAGDILLGEPPDPADPADPAEVLTRSFSEHGVVRSGIKGFRHLSGSAMRAVTHQLAEVVVQSLDLMDLRDMLINGWRKHKDLRAAAERTLNVEGSEELVALASHCINSTHSPSVDLIIKETKVHTCTFTVSVAFDLNGVLAVVRQGKLAALRGGTCVITVKLALGEIPLIPPQRRRIDLAKSITLNPAVRLLGETAKAETAQTGNGKLEERVDSR